MEIRGQPSRDMLIKNLWNNRVQKGGILLLVERGTPTGFRFMHHIRELFISEIGVDNFHFVAPCPHEGMCPMAVTGRDWCHFGQRLVRLPHYIYCKGSKAKFVEEEKFSFLAIRKGRGPRAKYKAEIRAPTPAEKSHFWPRIVLPVIRGGGHSLIDVCSAPGNFERISTSKSKSHSLGHNFARRDAMWGDLWRFPKRINRSEARPYISEEIREHLDRLAKRACSAMGLNREEREREAEVEG